jgi:hypothetical protein
MMRRVFSIVSNSMITSSKQLKWVGIPQCYQLTNRYQFTSTSGPSQTALLEEVEAKIHHVLRSVSNPLITGSQIQGRQTNQNSNVRVAWL